MEFSTIVNNEYFIFLVILMGFVLVGNVVHFIFKSVLHRFAQNSKLNMDGIILSAVAKPFFTLVILMGLYFSLKFLSVLQPYTKWLDGAFFVVFVFIFAYIVARILSVLVIRGLKNQKKYEKTPRLINKIIYVIVYLIGFLMILDYFKIEITPLIATFGLGGLAVGLALQSTLSNFFAGLHIISDRLVDVGDFIELPDAKVSGYVEDIGWRSTRIRSLLNQIIIVPNSKLAESIIINNTLPDQEMPAIVQVGVSYESDLKKVEEITIEVAKEIQKTVPGAVKNFEPFIRFHTFDDSNINFSVTLRVENFVDRFFIIHEFIKALKERYDKEGIEISWPVRKIYQAK